MSGGWRRSNRDAGAGREGRRNAGIREAGLRRPMRGRKLRGEAGGEEQGHGKTCEEGEKGAGQDGP